MSTDIIITAIICFTLIAITFLTRDSRKGGKK